MTGIKILCGFCDWFCCLHSVEKGEIGAVWGLRDLLDHTENSDLHQGVENPGQISFRTSRDVMGELG